MEALPFRYHYKFIHMATQFSLASSYNLAMYNKKHFQSWYHLEFFVDAAEKVVSAVEGFGLVAREGEFRMVASEGLLVEDGLISADEGELGGLDDLAKIVFNGKAHVEDLAEIGYVSIISILPSVAGEAPLGLPNDELVSIAELVGHVGAGDGGQSDQDEGGCVGEHY